MAVCSDRQHRRYFWLIHRTISYLLLYSLVMRYFGEDVLPPVPTAPRATAPSTAPELRHGAGGRAQTASILLLQSPAPFHGRGTAASER